MRGDATRLEERVAQLREKLHLAVKKGKEAVQQRDNLRATVEELEKAKAQGAQGQGQGQGTGAEVEELQRLVEAEREAREGKEQAVKEAEGRVREVGKRLAQLEIQMLSVESAKAEALKQNELLMDKIMRLEGQPWPSPFQSSQPHPRHARATSSRPLPSPPSLLAQCPLSCAVLFSRAGLALHLISPLPVVSSCLPSGWAYALNLVWL